MHLGKQHLRGTLPTCVLQIHKGFVSRCKRNYNHPRAPSTKTNNTKMFDLPNNHRHCQGNFWSSWWGLRWEAFTLGHFESVWSSCLLHTSLHLPLLRGTIQEFPPVWSVRGFDCTLNRWSWCSVAKRLVITNPTSRSGEIFPALWTYL